MMTDTVFSFELGALGSIMVPVCDGMADYDRKRTRTIIRISYAMINIFGKFRTLTPILPALMCACNSVQTGQQSSFVSGPSPSLATVYFYRPQNSPGAAVGVDITDNGIDVGTLQDGTYFVYHANPGQHSFTATTDTASTQNFRLQAGATYYIKAGVVSRQHLFQPSLSVVFDLQGQAAIQNLKRLPYHE
jgi:uncharacterized protein DUF2846